MQRCWSARKVWPSSSNIPLHHYSRPSFCSAWLYAWDASNDSESQAYAIRPLSSPTLAFSNDKSASEYAEFDRERSSRLREIVQRSELLEEGGEESTVVEFQKQRPNLAERPSPVAATAIFDSLQNSASKVSLQTVTQTHAYSFSAWVCSSNCVALHLRA